MPLGKPITLPKRIPARLRCDLKDLHYKYSRRRAEITDEHPLARDLQECVDFIDNLLHPRRP